MQKVPCKPQIGADIEAFVYNMKSRSYVPCVGILPGTKEKPHPLPDLPEGYAVQEDNVMAEFNIPPSHMPKRFSASIVQAIDGVTKMLPADHKLVFRSSVKFPAKDLTSPQAMRFGCDPDFDAYTGGTMRKPLDATGMLHRGAGGHIHLGGNFQCPDFVAALFADLFIGVFAGARNDPSDARSKFYGMPGIYRPKPYGIEYRTLSCEWANNSERRRWVANNAQRLATWLSNNDPVTLQKVFRSFNQWTQVRAFLMGETDDSQPIIDAAIRAGVPY